MTLEEFGCWLFDRKTGICLLVSPTARDVFTRQQAEQIAPQLDASRDFLQERFMHKKVKVDGREVYVATYGGFDSPGGYVDVPYLKKTIEGKAVYTFELTSNPSDILDFSEI